MDLHIELKTSSGEQPTYNYKHFIVDGPENDFTLHVGQIQQPVPGFDSMGYGNGQPFSTYDKDNDAWGLNCALSDYTRYWSWSWRWMVVSRLCSHYTNPTTP